MEEVTFKLMVEVLTMAIHHHHNHKVQILNEYIVLNIKIY
jgi:hypothetical protein